MSTKIDVSCDAIAYVRSVFGYLVVFMKCRYEI